MWCLLSKDPSHHERTLLPQNYISLLGMRNSSMGPPHEGSIRRPIAPWANALTTELHLAPEIAQWVQPMMDRSDDPSYHERMLLPQSYISLLGMRNNSMGPPHEGSIRRPIAPWANALPLSYVQLLLNEWMFNDTPARKTDRIIGCQTNAKLKPNSHIAKYVQIHKVIKYCVESCTL